MWPDGVLLGCYPHITWHLTHGMLLPKQHPLFEEACTTVPIMHLCETPGMWNVLLDGLAREWCKPPQKEDAAWAAACHGSNAK